MTHTHLSRILPISILLLIALAGCGGKQDSSSASGAASSAAQTSTQSSSSASGTASGAAKGPEQSVQNHLNDPNVSETEKAEIRKHMVPGGR